MTTTLTDPRLALCDRRAVLIGVITKQRAALKALCGCDRCGDAAAREQMAGLIYRNAQAISDLSDLITDHPTMQ